MTLPIARARNPFAIPRHPSEPAPGITLLGSQRVNFYVVAEGRSLTLVDCGFYGHRRYLEEWLSASGRRLSDIEAVVITHGHADHLGFAAMFSTHGIPVYVPGGDLTKARTTDVREPPPRLKRRLWHPSCVGMLLEATFDSVFTQPAVEAAEPYVPGQRLDVPGRLLPIAVPGHSPGNACLYSEAHHAMFTGDSLMTRDPMGYTVGAVVFAEHPAKNAEAFASLDKLRGFREATLMPAHGEPWTNAGDLGRALDQARII